MPKHLRIIKNRDKSVVAEVTVVSEDQYHHHSRDFEFGDTDEAGSLNKVIGSLLKIWNSIPPEYRDDARCEISSESEYEGSHYAAITVSYRRQATTDEIAKIETDEAERCRIAAEQERLLFETLRAKYG